MLKIRLNEMLSHPLHASAFVALFSLLIFLPLIRPTVLVSALVYVSMFFGAVFARTAGANDSNPTP
jgi:hypothetical protein